MEKKNIKYYLPSNGTEGMNFMAEFCDKCYKGLNCSISLKALCGYQPKQWIYAPDPVCTSFNPNRPKPKKKQQKGMVNLF